MDEEADKRMAGSWTLRACHFFSIRVKLFSLAFNYKGKTVVEWAAFVSRHIETTSRLKISCMWFRYRRENALALLQPPMSE